MNSIYGALVLVSALLNSRFFERHSARLSYRIAAAVIIQFLAVVLLGLLYWYFNWGFFSGLNNDQDKLQQVLGLAGFVALLVGLKVWNRHKRDLLEQQE